MSTAIRAGTTSLAGASAGAAASTRTDEGAETDSLRVTEVSADAVMTTAGDGAGGAAVAAGAPKASASSARPARKRSRRRESQSLGSQ